MRMALTVVDSVADQANMWRPGIGVVHHACGGRADVVGWTGSTGPGGPAT